MKTNETTKCWYPNHNHKIQTLTTTTSLLLFILLPFLLLLFRIPSTNSLAFQPQQQQLFSRHAFVLTNIQNAVVSVSSPMTTQLLVRPTNNTTTTTTATTTDTTALPMSSSTPSSSVQTINNSITFPLRFLPNGGCWALRITLSSSSPSSPSSLLSSSSLYNPNNNNQQSFTYYGIIDTGSPFLTVPSSSQVKASSSSTATTNNILQPSRFETTYEQYGETIDGTEWCRVPFTTLSATTTTPTTPTTGKVVLPHPSQLVTKNVVFAVVSEKVVRETGGVFVGLIHRDDSRPTTIQQLFGSSSTMGSSSGGGSGHTTTTTTAKQYDAGFVIDFENDLLTFCSGSGLVPKEEPTNHSGGVGSVGGDGGGGCTLPLVDLQPYGPDLYHYAVRCDRLTVWFDDDENDDDDDPLLIPSRSSTTNIDTRTTTTTNNNGLCQGSSKSSVIKSLKKLTIDVSSSLDRPVLVVLDTGLTGCIFSDSLTKELSFKYPCYDWNTNTGRETTTTTTTIEDGGGEPSSPTLLSNVRAVNVWLPEGTDNGSNSSRSDKGGSSSSSGGGVELKSRDKYFYLSSFRLPWFYDEDRHPHIVAVGTTFWTNTKSLAVDLISRRVRIEL